MKKKKLISATLIVMNLATTIGTAAHAADGSAGNSADSSKDPMDYLRLTPEEVQKRNEALGSVYQYLNKASLGSVADVLEGMGMTVFSWRDNTIQGGSSLSCDFHDKKSTMDCAVLYASGYMPTALQDSDLSFKGVVDPSLRDNSDTAEIWYQYDEDWKVLFTTDQCAKTFGQDCYHSSGAFTLANATHKIGYYGRLLDDPKDWTWTGGLTPLRRKFKMQLGATCSNDQAMSAAEAIPSKTTIGSVLSSIFGKRKPTPASPASVDLCTGGGELVSYSMNKTENAGMSAFLLESFSDATTESAVASSCNNVTCASADYDVEHTTFYSSINSRIFQTPVMTNLMDAMNAEQLKALDAEVVFIKDPQVTLPKMGSTQSPYFVLYPDQVSSFPIPRPIIFIGSGATTADLDQMLKTEAVRIFAYNKLFDSGLLGHTSDAVKLMSERQEFEQEVLAMFKAAQQKEAKNHAENQARASAAKTQADANLEEKTKRIEAEKEREAQIAREIAWEAQKRAFLDVVGNILSAGVATAEVIKTNYLKDSDTYSKYHDNCKHVARDLLGLVE